MRAEVKHFEWFGDNDQPDAGNALDLPTLLVLHIGPVGGPGDELFQLEVTTPQAFASIVEKAGPMLGRHYLFVHEFNRSRVEAFVTKWVSMWEAPTWHELGEKLARLAHWEFEDYRESP